MSWGKKNKVFLIVISISNFLISMRFLSHHQSVSRLCISGWRSDVSKYLSGSEFSDAWLTSTESVSQARVPRDTHLQLFASHYCVSIVCVGGKYLSDLSCISESGSARHGDYVKGRFANENRMCSHRKAANKIWKYWQGKRQSAGRRWHYPTISV